MSRLDKIHFKEDRVVWKIIGFNNWVFDESLRYDGFIDIYATN